jgi:hypothetical protein
MLSSLLLLPALVPLAYGQLDSGQQPLVVPGSHLINDSVTDDDWNDLRLDVQGRLFKGVPFAQPCFSEGFNSNACQAIRSGYTKEGELTPTSSKLN